MQLLTISIDSAAFESAVAEGTGPESREYVAALAHVEIAPGVANEPGARGPAASLQHLLPAEVRLRVLLVRIADETGIGSERGRDPFPDVPNHLPAAERAVSRGERAHVDGPARAMIEVCAIRCRRRVAPGEAALASRLRIEARSHLPLRLGRQPAPRPFAPCLRFPPAHADDGVPRTERHDFIEHLLTPSPAIGDPEQRMLDSGAPAPIPSLGAPDFSPSISAVIDEGLELRVGDRRGVDAEGFQLDRMGPLFVVEDERLSRFRAEHERTARHRHVLRLVGLVDGWIRRGALE